MWNVLTGGGVLIDANDSFVRIIFRGYFTVVLLLVMYLGSEICVLRPQLFLLRKGQVPVMEMTGWLSAFDAARAMWLTRSLKPLGLMGFIMILVGTMMTVSDLAVSGFVEAHDVPGRCPLNEATRFWIFPGPEVVLEEVEPGFAHPFLKSTDVIREAINNNKNNGGERGIYRAIDNDRRFRADASDIAGSWRCIDRGEVPERYNYTMRLRTDITPDLQKNGYLHNNPPNITRETQRRTRAVYTEYPDRKPDGTPDPQVYWPNDIVLWSTNFTMNEETGHNVGPWELLAVLEKSSEQFTDHVLEAYRCTVDAPQLDWVFLHMEPEVSWSLWTDTFGTALYGFNQEGEGLVDNPMEVMEDVMNLMWMSMGLLYGENGTLADGTRMEFMDTTGSKGCWVAKTNVPWPIITMFVITALLLLWSVGYSGLLWFQVRRATRSQAADGAVPYVPVGLMSWLKHAAYTPDGNPHEVNSRVLRNYVFGVRDGRSETMKVEDGKDTKHEAGRRSPAPTIKVDISTEDLFFSLPIEGVKEREEDKIVRYWSGDSVSPADSVISVDHIR